MCSGRVEKLRNAKQVENCRVLRLPDGLVEIYGNKIVISTYRGHVTIRCKIQSIEDPNGLLDECGW